MEKSTRTIATFFALVLIIAGLYFFSDWFSKTTGYVLGEDEKIKLAQCLAGDKKSVFYTENDCADCFKQIERFGEEAFSSIPVVDCSQNNICDSLKTLPAWEIDGKFYYGDRELGELIEISGCDIKEE